MSEHSSLLEYRKGLTPLSPDRLTNLKPAPLGTCVTEALHDAGYNHIELKPDIPLEELVEQCRQQNLLVRDPDSEIDTAGVPLIAIYRVGHPEERKLHAEFTENMPGLQMEGKKIVKVIETPHY